MASSGILPSDPPDIGARLRDFRRFLDLNAITCDPGTLVDLYGIAANGYLQQPTAFRDATRACLCRTRQDWQRYDALFDAFWFPTRLQAGPADDVAQQRDDKLTDTGSQRLLGFGGSSEKLAQHETVIGAGDFKALSLADFRFIFDPREKLLVEQLVERMARRARRQFHRRQRPAGKGSRLDLRRTLKMQASGGFAAADLAWQRPRKRLPKLVLLLDISQSMDVYTRVFLRFTRALLGVFEQSEAFAFNTTLFRLGRGSRRLCEADFEQVLNDTTRGWLGGTRIAGSLRAFNLEHLSRAVNRRTTVVIFSDGCDTERPERLAAEVETIQWRARQLVWVNPLLGRFAAGEPDRYMDPVVPFVDAYCSAHDVMSLAQLTHVLLR